MRRPLRAGLAAFLLAAALGGSALAEPGVDLEGTWHVLVHYRDSGTAHPDASRWEDRIWIFERTPDGLRWTDYPIVVFEDESGRFEWLGTNRQVRVVHAWEPNAAQQEQIRTGLEVNSRGSRTKVLRGSPETGWRSEGAPRPASAMVITYSESWSVTGTPERPVFVREDSLSSASAEGMEGRTEYRTEEVLEEGARLRGRYERDGARVGSFRMQRAGASSKVKGSARTPAAGATALLMRQAGTALMEHEGLAPRVAELRAGSALTEEARAEVRRQVRAALARHVQAQGINANRLRPEIESLARKIEHALLDDGRSLDEVRRMVEDGRLAP